MTKPVVINASVAVKWVNLIEPLSFESRRLLSDFKARKLRVIVPVFWCYEIANALRKAVNRNELNFSQAEQALSALMGLPVEIHPLPDPLTAFKASLNFGCSLYDAFYLVLEEKFGCEFWTADHRLYNACRNRWAWVRWIGDYSPLP